MISKSFLILLTLCLIASPTYADETQSTELKTTSSKSAPLWKSIVSRFSISGIVFPTVFSNGFGARVEARLLPSFSLSLSQQRSEQGSAGGMLSVELGESTLVRSTSMKLGLHYYAISTSPHKFYLGAGTKWVKVESKQSLSIFSAEARSERGFTGGYTEVGYVYKRPSHPWFAGASISYAPGNVKSIEYVAEEVGILGPTKAKLNVEYEYGYFPQGFLGYHF